MHRDCEENYEAWEDDQALVCDHDCAYHPAVDRRGVEAVPLTCGTWSVVPNPPIASNNAFLNGVATVSSNNVWAVGNIGSNQTLAENWNGTQWNIVASPNVGVESVLNAVTSVPGTNEHWDGTSWSVVSSPNQSPVANYLFAVTRVPGTSQLWAVGFNAVGQYNQPLTEFYC